MPQLPEGHATSLLERSSNFTIELLGPFEIGKREHEERVLNSVVSPLLAVAEECFVYGMKKEGETWKAAADILSPERGKYRVSNICNPIVGRELFWIPQRWGKRGTILFVVPIDKFSFEEIFQKYVAVWVLENYRSPHTPGAMKFAQNKLSEGRHIIFALDGTGSLRAITVFAPMPLVFDLYSKADERQ